MGASTELVFIDSTKLMIPEVPILAGQVIYSADTNETYYDTGSGIRMQISNSSYLYSEDDRPGLENPKEHYLYIVKSTARLYKYTLGAGFCDKLCRGIGDRGVDGARENSWGGGRAPTLRIAWAYPSAHRA